MGRTDARISWRGETSHPTAPSWVNLPTHSRSQSMAKATSQSYALRPERSVTVQQPVPVKRGLVLYTGWMPSPRFTPSRGSRRSCRRYDTPVVSVHIGGTDTTQGATGRNSVHTPAKKSA